MKKRTVDLSGFGGGYEAMCQTMLWRGVAWLAERKPDLSMWEGTYPEYTPERTELEAVMFKEGEDATGAMLGAAISTVAYIHHHGVEKWLANVAAKEPDRIYDAEVTL